MFPYDAVSKQHARIEFPTAAVFVTGSLVTKHVDNVSDVVHWYTPLETLHSFALLKVTYPLVTRTSARN